MSEPKIIKLRHLDFGEDAPSPSHRTFICPYWDLLPALSADEREELKASIQAHRMKTPIIAIVENEDEAIYRVIDGYHRLSIAEELGLASDDIPQEIIGDTDYEEEKLDALAEELNLKRRHMSAEQRAEWVVKLRAKGKSIREIADQIGASKSQVARDLATVPDGTVELPDTIIGKDKRERPATMPPREPPPQIEIPIPVREGEASGVARPIDHDKRPEDHDATAELYPSPYSQGRLSISSPVESSQRVSTLFNEAEQRRATPDVNARSETLLPPAVVRTEEGSSLPGMLGSLGDTSREVASSVAKSVPRAERDDAGEDPASDREQLPLSDSAKAQAQVHGVSQPSLTYVPFGEANVSLTHTDPSNPSMVQLPQPTDQGAASAAPEKNGDYQDGNTPQWLIDLVRKVNPSIALDPFSNPYSLVNAIVALEREQDGMRSDISWAAIAREHNGLVYCNPPYSDPTKPAERSIEEANKGAEVVLCLPSSHSTAWYKLLRKACQAYSQLGRKVAFGLKGVYGSTAKHETTIFYFGPQWLKFWGVFEADGHEVIHGGTSYQAPLDLRQQGLPFPVAPQKEETKEPPKTEEKIQIYCHLCKGNLLEENHGQTEAHLKAIEDYNNSLPGNGEEKDEEFPSPWMERSIKAIQATTTREECKSVAFAFIDKASTGEEMDKLAEACEAHHAKLPHAENVRSPRLTSVDKLLAALLKCNYVAKGKDQLDEFKKKSPLSEHADLDKAFDQWRKTKPASTPYNRKEKKTAIKTPKPTRNRGKNEEKRVKKRGAR